MYVYKGVKPISFEEFVFFTSAEFRRPGRSWIKPLVVRVTQTEASSSVWDAQDRDGHPGQAAAITAGADRVRKSGERFDLRLLSPDIVLIFSCYRSDLPPVFLRPHFPAKTLICRIDISIDHGCGACFVVFIRHYQAKQEVRRGPGETGSSAAMDGPSLSQRSITRASCGGAAWMESRYGES